MKLHTKAASTYMLELTFNELKVIAEALNTYPDSKPEEIYDIDDRYNTAWDIWDPMYNAICDITGGDHG